MQRLVDTDDKFVVKIIQATSEIVLNTILRLGSSGQGWIEEQQIQRWCQLQPQKIK